jgi:hypothetical protein
VTKGVELLEAVARRDASLLLAEAATFELALASADDSLAMAEEAETDALSTAEEALALTDEMTLEALKRAEEMLPEALAATDEAEPRAEETEAGRLAVL